MTIVILDVETTGVDPKTDFLVELAWARYDLQHGFIECSSRLLGCFSGPNKAEHVNGISKGLIDRHGGDQEFSLRNCVPHLDEARCIVAHQASFDSQWIKHVGVVDLPWVCSREDIEWPSRSSMGSCSLEKLALAEGVGVLPGHRAIYDVMTIVRTFDAVRERGCNMTKLIESALTPKSLFQSKHPFASNDTAQKAGFRWDGARKAWCRKMTDDAAKLLQSTYPYNIYKLES